MSRLGPLSWTMRSYLQRIVAAGDDGMVDYHGRTHDALERRGLIESRRCDDPNDRFLWKRRVVATDAGRAALQRKGVK